MRGKSRGFFGLSTGALPLNFKPHVWVPPLEPASRRSAKPAPRPASLTANERLLIEKHLPFYLAMARGTRKANTEAQRHFVAVCRGTARPATPHEIAFLKWRVLRRKKGTS
jgi:hypothetical protein